MSKQPIFGSAVLDMEFAAALASGRLPLKFAYIGSAARTHDQLAHRQSYHDVAITASFEADHLVGKFGTPDECNQVVDIGPGNGTHSALLLTRLRDVGVSATRYLGLDISKELLAIATQIITELRLFDSVGSEVWDVESGPTDHIERWRRQKQSVACLLLGHTIGNLQNPASALSSLRESLRAGDTLAMSAALRGSASPDELMLPYLDPVFVAAALEPLRMVGVYVSESEFQIRFDQSLSAVIGEVNLSSERMASINGQQILLGNSGPIQCFYSRRFERSDLSELLNVSGWSVDQSFSSGNGRHELITARIR